MRIVGLCLLLLLAKPVLANTAIFAGGCFWCVEAAYQEVDGVEGAVSGFTGGELENPTYKGNHEGHYEAVKLTYDHSIISYEKLLEIFWHNLDPFDDGGQFCDRGFSYKSAIFTNSDEQLAAAEQSKASVIAQFPMQSVVTPIRG